MIPNQKYLNLIWITVCVKYLFCSSDIKSFSYVFPCNFARKHNEADIYGTGGMILQDMKNLLAYLPGLKRLELGDLELDGFDGTNH